MTNEKKFKMRNAQHVLPNKNTPCTSPNYNSLDLPQYSTGTLMTTELKSKIPVIFKRTTSVDMSLENVLPERTRLRRQRRLRAQDRYHQDKPEDTIERLNRLRTKISGALSEVKGVLKQYSTEIDQEEERKNNILNPATDIISTKTDNCNHGHPIHFRFVKKVMRYNTFDDTNESDDNLLSDENIVATRKEEKIEQNLNALATPEKPLNFTSHTHEVPCHQTITAESSVQIESNENEKPQKKLPILNIEESTNLNVDLPVSNGVQVVVEKSTITSTNLDINSIDNNNKSHLMSKENLIDRNEKIKTNKIAKKKQAAGNSKQMNDEVRRASIAAVEKSFIQPILLTPLSGKMHRRPSDLESIVRKKKITKKSFVNDNIAEMTNKSKINKFKRISTTKIDVNESKVLTPTNLNSNIATICDSNQYVCEASINAKIINDGIVQSTSDKSSKDGLMSSNKITTINSETTKSLMTVTTDIAKVPARLMIEASENKKPSSDREHYISATTITNKTVRTPNTNVLNNTTTTKIKNSIQSNQSIKMFGNMYEGVRMPTSTFNDLLIDKNIINITTSSIATPILDNKECHKLSSQQPQPYLSQYIKQEPEKTQNIIKLTPEKNIETISLTSNINECVAVQPIKVIKITQTNIEDVKNSIIVPISSLELIVPTASSTETSTTALTTKTEEIKETEKRSDEETRSLPFVLEKDNFIEQLALKNNITKDIDSPQIFKSISQIKQQNTLLENNFNIISEKVQKNESIIKQESIPIGQVMTVQQVIPASVQGTEITADSFTSHKKKIIHKKNVRQVSVDKVKTKDISCKSDKIIQTTTSPLDELKLTTNEINDIEIENVRNSTEIEKPKRERKIKKKVIIKRQQRFLSTTDVFFGNNNNSIDESTDFNDIEILMKPIAYVTDDENDDEVISLNNTNTDQEKTRLKSCLKQRDYQIGDEVLYAERFKKTQVRWKRGKIKDRITSISYLIDIEGKDVSAHINYIKKFSERKVKFDRKEYLEIDYERLDEDEESPDEYRKRRNYNIWNMV